MDKPETAENSDRRETDRRAKDQPINFPDRRNGDRRSHADRRAKPRSSFT